MTIDEIVKLVQAVSENGLTSFEYEEGNQKLVLKKKAKVCVVQAPAGQNIPAATAVAAGIDYQAVSDTHMEVSTAGVNSDKIVESPLVGTFYSSASPSDDSFVKVGDTVKKGQVLGIIEAMKLMNEIESEYDGVVEAILVSNEDVVEFGQPLFRIK